MQLLILTDRKHICQSGWGNQSESPPVSIPPSRAPCLPKRRPQPIHRRAARRTAPAHAGALSFWGWGGGRNPPVTGPGFGWGLSCDGSGPLAPKRLAYRSHDLSTGIPNPDRLHGQLRILHGPPAISAVVPVPEVKLGSPSTAMLQLRRLTRVVTRRHPKLVFCSTLGTPGSGRTSIIGNGNLAEG